MSFAYNAADQERGIKHWGQLRYNPLSFAHGASRRAYRCRVSRGCIEGFSEGSYLVFKMFKPSFRNMEMTSKDIDMQKMVKALAKRFTAEHSKQCPLIMRDAALGTFDSHVVPSRRDNNGFHKSGKRFLIEREIRGTFEKFNSNNGWTSGLDPIIQAFSHWTYHVTGRKLLVCDLQGHRGTPKSGKTYLGKKRYYLLTDPAINSADREYGMNDLGQEGIDAFFHRHTCNHLCKAWGLHGNRPSRPTPRVCMHIERVIPKSESTSYHAMTTARIARTARTTAFVRSATFDEDDESEDCSDADSSDQYY